MTATQGPGERQNLPVDQRRHDSIVPEAANDPYRSIEEPPIGTVCGGCGLTVRDGRWSWSGEIRSLGAPASRIPDGTPLCPACRRIRDAYPAGFVTLSGEFLQSHLGEVLDVVRVTADLELDEHPLNRIMALDTGTTGVDITTTDIHLARRIGEALRNACDGELDVRYLDDEQRVRVAWSRSAAPGPAPHAEPAEPPSEVVTHDLALSGEAAEYLRHRIARLPQYYDSILSSRVVVRGETRHHQTGGPYSVHVQIDVPQRVIVVTRQQRNHLHVAIREAFDAAQRQLQDHARKQRGDGSPTVKPLTARVGRVFPALGYGFIETDEGDVYFHRNAVLDGRFDAMTRGAEVRYELEAGEKGLQASTVAVIAP